MYMERPYEKVGKEMKRRKVSLALILVSFMTAIINSCWSIILANKLSLDVHSNNLFPFVVIVGVLTLLNILTLRDYIRE